MSKKVSPNRGVSEKLFREVKRRLKARGITEPPEEFVRRAVMRELIRLESPI